MPKKNPAAKEKEQKEHLAAIAARLTALYPGAECALRWQGEPWRLMVLARLSAQCTDARVNIVGEALFTRFPTAAALAAAPLAEIEELVRPCGLYRVKAQNIRDEMRLLTDTYGGELPADMETLLSFPGVGRKIANLLRGDVFGLPAVVADTHCIRICGRFGLYPETVRDPLVTERTVTTLLDPAATSDFCHRIVLFGREYCTARSPRCPDCPLTDLCPHAGAKK